MITARLRAHNIRALIASRRWDSADYEHMALFRSRMAASLRRKIPQMVRPYWGTKEPKP